MNVLAAVEPMLDARRARRRGAERGSPAARRRAARLRVDARVLRRLRAPHVQARRAHGRRLLRDDARAHRSASPPPRAWPGNRSRRRRRSARRARRATSPRRDPRGRQRSTAPSPSEARFGEEARKEIRRLGRGESARRASTSRKQLAAAKMLQDGGVDVINIADGARAQARMGNLAMAARVAARARDGDDPPRVRPRSKPARHARASARARTSSACETSSSSPAIRRRWATSPTRRPSTISTRSAS